jgi:hypothetical protein
MSLVKSGACVGTHPVEYLVAWDGHIDAEAIGGELFAKKLNNRPAKMIRHDIGTLRTYGCCDEQIFGDLRFW